MESEEFQVVKELRDGKLIFPRNIPNDRGNTANITLYLLGAVSLAICVQFVYRESDLIKALKYTICALLCNNIVLIGCSITNRFAQFFEEVQHMHSRYEDNFFTVVKAAFGFNTISIVIISVTLVTYVAMTINVGCPFKYIWNFEPLPYFSSLTCSLLLMSLIGINESRLNTALTLKSMKGLDYGSSMAYSFYYGYLNIILPEKGTENRGMYERIEQYEAHHNVSIPVKKLFILIPTSLRVPPDLREATNNWMEGTTLLESIIMNRAGVKRRVYKNTVYKIHPEGEEQGHRPVYVLAEGATPLLTFYEVLEHSGVDASSYKDYQREIVLSFYTTLLRLIRKPESRDVCELVYYEDIDRDNRKVNVAKILLQRIREQTGQQS